MSNTKKTTPNKPVQNLADVNKLLADATEALKKAKDRIAELELRLDTEHKKHAEQIVFAAAQMKCVTEAKDRVIFNLSDALNKVINLNTKAVAS